MNTTKQRRQRNVMVAIVAMAIAGVAAFGFAAANSVPETGAGDGTGIISGYDVTNIHYTLATDPTYLDGMTMNVAPKAGSSAGPAGSVSVVFTDDADATLGSVACTDQGAGDWSCDLSGAGITVLDAANLRVIAVE